MNEKNEKRGRPWPKGVSGNPAGRPRTGLAIAEQARAQVERRGLVAKLATIAASKSSQAVRACELLLNYAYGKPHAEMTLETRGSADAEFGRLRELLMGALEGQPAEVRQAIARRLFEMDKLIKAEAAGNGLAQ